MRTVPVLLAVALVAVLGAAPALGGAQPDHVSCSYDETQLRNYQPETSVDHLDVEPTASYGGVYSSPERETDVYVYFLRYSHQDGVTPVDSHVGDHEPVYVLVDSRTGDVERVVYSAYHYLKGGGAPSGLPMNGSHVRLHVVEPWHQYEPTDASGSRVELRNYCDAVDDWHANGWGASEAATTNPWTMTDRESWWSEDSLRYSASERYREARRTLGETTPDFNGSFSSVSDDTERGLP